MSEFDKDAAIARRDTILESATAAMAAVGFIRDGIPHLWGQVSGFTLKLRPADMVPGEWPISLDVTTARVYYGYLRGPACQVTASVPPLRKKSWNYAHSRAAPDWERIARELVVCLGAAASEWEKIAAKNLERRETLARADARAARRKQLADMALEIGRAFLRAERRFNPSYHEYLGADGVPAEWQDATQIAVEIRDCEKAIHRMGVVPRDNHDALRALGEVAKAWLQERYPDWRDAGAYWDTPPGGDPIMGTGAAGA